MCVCFSIYGLLYFVISRRDPDNISLLSCVTLTFLKHLLVCLAVLVISSLASSCASVHISRIICIYPLLLTLYMWLLCGSDHLSPPACRIRGLSYYNSIYKLKDCQAYLNDQVHSPIYSLTSCHVHDCMSSIQV